MIPMFGIDNEQTKRIENDLEVIAKNGAWISRALVVILQRIAALFKIELPPAPEP